MYHDDKLTGVIIDLQERGFNHDFVIAAEHIKCLQYNELIPPEDFEIMETHHCRYAGKRREGNLIYAVRLVNCDVKGILISDYRSYIKGMSFRLWSKFYHIIRLKVSGIKRGRSKKQISK